MPKVEPFEKHVDIYEEWFVRNRFAYESELQAIRALLPEDGTGIEIGVGTGRLHHLVLNSVLSHPKQ